MTLKMGANSESLGFAVAIYNARPLIEGRQPVATARPPRPRRKETRSPAPSAADRRSDQLRSRGAAQYEEILVAVAQRVAQIDPYWNRFPPLVRGDAGVERLP